MLPEDRGSPPKVDLLDMPKTMEQIIDYLNMFCGVSSVCLDHVVRKLLILITSADDPNFNYVMRDLEMTVHSPIMVPETRGA